MFLLRSHHRTAATLNPAPTAEETERRERQLGQCRDLAALAMQLAREAHREAMRDLQPPKPGRTSPVPGEAVILPADSRGDMFGLLFAQLSRCVRQAILLENRIAAGDPPPHLARTQATPRHATEHPTAEAAESVDAAPRLDHERLEDECAGPDRPAEDILRDLRRQVAGASSTLGPATAGPAEERPPWLQSPPPPPLTAWERSAVEYHRQRLDPPKPARRPRPPDG